MLSQLGSRKEELEAFGKQGPLAASLKEQGGTLKLHNQANAFYHLLKLSLSPQDLKGLVKEAPVKKMLTHLKVNEEAEKSN